MHNRFSYGFIICFVNTLLNYIIKAMVILSFSLFFSLSLFLASFLCYRFVIERLVFYVKKHKLFNDTSLQILNNFSCLKRKLLFLNIF